MSEEPEVSAPVVFSPDDPQPDVAVEEVAVEAQGEAEPEVEEAPKKDPVKALQGRVGALTRTANTYKAELAQARAEAEALKAMLPPGTEPDKPTQVITEADIEARADQLAADRLFREDCNKVFEDGAAKFKDDFQGAVDTLNASGIMSRGLIEAALETGAAPEVIHFLGQDLEEAERIAQLSPAKQGVALAKIALKLTTKVKTSNAPAPIKPLGGGAKPEFDIYSPDNSMEQYAELRAKQGAPWAQPARSH